MLNKKEKNSTKSQNSNFQEISKFNNIVIYFMQNTNINMQTNKQHLLSTVLDAEAFDYDPKRRCKKLFRADWD